jgi:hypothetical protein
MLRVFAATLFLQHAGWASAGTAPTPGGIYKLNPGIYVAEGEACEVPASAAIRVYNGEGIETAHTRRCNAVVRASDRDTYDVEQSCIDTGALPGKRFSEQQVIIVRNPSTFVQAVGRDSTTFHYCPIRRLPPEPAGGGR